MKGISKFPPVPILAVFGDTRKPGAISESAAVSAQFRNGSHCMDVKLSMVLNHFAFASASDALRARGARGEKGRTGSWG